MYTHTDTGVELLGHMSSIPRLRRWQPTPVFLPGKFHGQKSLAGYSPWGLSWTWLSIHIIVLRLIFWKASILFTTMAAPVYIPTKSVQIFLFLHILANIYLCSSWWLLFWSMWGVTSVGVDLHFFEDYRCKASFPVPVCHLYLFLGKHVYWDNCPFLNEVCFFGLLFSCMNSLYILDISPLQNIWIANIFSYFISFLSVLFSLPLLYFRLLLFACLLCLESDPKNHSWDSC